MITTSSINKTNSLNLLQILFGILSAFILVGALSNVSISMGISDRTSLIALMVTGMTMCAMSPLGRGTELGWANPRHILGYLIGSAALLLSGAALFNQQILWIHSDHDAILSLAVLMTIKILLATTYPHSKKD